MKTLRTKLFRDLWGMKGQALAIAMVIVSGVATYVISVSTLDSLRETRAAFYRDYRFAELFVSLKRAPESVAESARAIPGVDRVETRVAAWANLDVPGFPEPIRGLVVSVPDAGEPAMNALHLRAGRNVAPGRDDEVVASEAFAQAHRLRPGDRIGAVIHGKRKALRLVGIGLSPEHVYEVGPGAVFPDPKRYGVLWMGRKALAAGYGMEGAFNDLCATLAPGASRQDAIDRLDALLSPYGGLGAYARDDQVSHRYLTEEFRQLGTLAEIFPVIFLGVAAFLLNVVVGRLVSLQRDQVGILKAFGYPNAAIGMHYVKLIVLIVLVGVAGGIGVGAWLGRGMTRMYMAFYRFPYLHYELRASVAATAALVSVASAVVGALQAVRKAARMTPAEAMRPEPPGRFRVTLVERLGLRRILSQPARMIARNVARRPVKSALSMLGIGFACAILMLGNVQEDAVGFMVDTQFRLAQREDMTVVFVEPASARALSELRSLPGVRHGEPYRTVPARLRFGHRSYRTAVQGFPRDGGVLHRVLDTRLQPVAMPREGILMTDYLAERLGLRTGDRVTVEFLEGSRPIRDVPVAGLVGEYFGVNAYMDLYALNRLLGEGNAISGAFLSADREDRQGVYDALKEMPGVAGTVVREDAIRSFYDSMGGTLLLFTFVITLLAGSVAFGVVYNSARIALSERSRELASLRVLGFTRGEISYILLGELGVLTLAAIPLGFLIAQGITAYIAERMKSDLYRVPMVMEWSSYGFAAAVVIVAALLSGLLVRRRLDRLDLVAVLKTKE
ncbi:MAG TPA: ABC transporter permease [Deltaproteobacteria bacterium]|nr:MAG: ABC transporter permease [Deltaproteobacteria bacterium GWA2_65_63]OGP29264.1 MAG: ABC transporter permease [Deltaproteobacteria bacterium GWB2_65_81]OGP36973.1 MAG: ABC transporter permease [Deltaproteobacteria bacterium GWC2_66_88]HAM33065.1 ABC transporter permease [Deltaproteobacteria bacterium]HBG72580.1 ABC transporter permease [Deltaproteobacteria bacterium]